MININAAQIVRTNTDLKEAKVLVKNLSFKKTNKNFGANTEKNFKVRQSLRKDKEELMH